MNKGFLLSNSYQIMNRTNLSGPSFSFSTSKNCGAEGKKLSKGELFTKLVIIIFLNILVILAQNITTIFQLKANFQIYIQKLQLNLSIT